MREVKKKKFFFLLFFCFLLFIFITKTTEKNYFAITFLFFLRKIFCLIFKITFNFFLFYKRLLWLFWLSSPLRRFVTCISLFLLTHTELIFPRAHIWDNSLFFLDKIIRSLFFRIISAYIDFPFRRLLITEAKCDKIWKRRT